MSLKPRHLKRYRDLFFLFLKHRKDIAIEAMGRAPGFLSDALCEADVPDGKPQELAEDLEEMGPTFIKLGQLLSTRSDLLPAPYLEALARLQDNVKPFPVEEVAATIEAELGVSVDAVFPRFDTVPLGAASLAQVHRATLASGREVIVKVQRPGMMDVIQDDLEALDDLTRFIDRHTETGRRYAFNDLFDEFRTNLLAELDYRQEARNLLRMREVLRAYPRITVPQPVLECTSRRVLTMDYVEGKPIDHVGKLGLTELDGAALAEDLAEAYLDQILVEGFFHADPHPGNVLLTPDGKLALLDLGMVARVEPDLRYRLVRLLLALGEGRGGDVARILGGLGRRLDSFDEDNYMRTVSNLVVRYRDVVVSEANPGRMLMDLVQTAARSGLRPPASLVMLGRTMAHLADVTNRLDPDFSPNELMRKRARRVIQRQMAQRLSPAEILDTFLESGDFLQRLPERLNRFMENLSENKMRLELALDDAAWSRGLERSARRITAGLILAALIVSAGLFNRADATFHIFGHPGMSMLMFLAAAGMALVMLVGWIRRRPGG
jgi:predicted unusual protein kinase regulating ubiquinone biosynthesis (AarF/ABC1/UbiB family)